MVWFLLTWRFVCRPHEREVGGPKDLELGGCEGTERPWKSIGNVIVNAGAKQAQTQEAERVQGGMRRGGACHCTALICSFFILLEKVIKVLFMTQVTSSCLFDDAGLLGRCTVTFLGLRCVALLSWLRSAESVSFSGVCE